jgi:hypothetical protein
MLQRLLLYMEKPTTCVNITRTTKLIQGDSWVVGFIAGDDFLGLVMKKLHIKLCPILNGYRVMTALNLG